MEEAVNGHDNTTLLRQPASLLLEHMIYTTTDLNYQLIHCLNYMCIYNYISLFISCSVGLIYKLWHVCKENFSWNVLLTNDHVNV